MFCLTILQGGGSRPGEVRFECDPVHGGADSQGASLRPDGEESGSRQQTAPHSASRSRGLSSEWNGMIFRAGTYSSCVTSDLFTPEAWTLSPERTVFAPDLWVPRNEVFLGAKQL